MLAAGHDADSLTGEVISGYLEARLAAGYRARAGRRALVPLLDHLRGLGVVPQPAAGPATPAEALRDQRRRGRLPLKVGVRAAQAPAVSPTHGLFFLVMRV